MPALVPSAPAAFDVDCYLVLEDFGKLGRAFRETDEERCDKFTVINNIIAGEYGRIIRIVGFNTAEGWSRDVSEDIAREVWEEAHARHERLVDDAREFVERFDLEAA